MRLNKVTYHADFVVYPLLILALSNEAMRDATLRQRLDWLGACAVGIAGWTLAEYVLHRFALHRIPVLERMHDAHHEDPTALVGTPIWVSLATFGVLGLILWRGTDANVAGGLTCGLMAGYLWYIAVHHVVHHWRLEHDTYLYRLKRRHAKHHYSDEDCNYGVSTGFWDRILHTADPTVAASPARAHRNKNNATPQT